MFKVKPYNSCSKFEGSSAHREDLWESTTCLRVSGMVSMSASRLCQKQFCTPSYWPNMGKIPLLVLPSLWWCSYLGACKNSLITMLSKSSFCSHSKLYSFSLIMWIASRLVFWIWYFLQWDNLIIYLRIPFPVILVSLTSVRYGREKPL